MLISRQICSMFVAYALLGSLLAAGSEETVHLPTETTESMAEDHLEANAHNEGVFDDEQRMEPREKTTNAPEPKRTGSSNLRLGVSNSLSERSGGPRVITRKITLEGTKVCGHKKCWNTQYTCRGRCKLVCSGFLSCLNIVATNWDKFDIVTCTGANSCKGVNMKKTGTIIQCQGTAACSGDPNWISGRNIFGPQARPECTGNDSCQHSHWEVANMHVKCPAFRACTNTYMKCVKGDCKLTCSGFESCKNKSSSGKPFPFRSGYIGFRTVKCTGVGSCQAENANWKVDCRAKGKECDVVCSGPGSCLSRQGQSYKAKWAALGVRSLMCTGKKKTWTPTEEKKQGLQGTELWMAKSHYGPRGGCYAERGGSWVVACTKSAAGCSLSCIKPKGAGGLNPCGAQEKISNPLVFTCPGTGPCIVKSNSLWGPTKVDTFESAKGNQAIQIDVIRSVTAVKNTHASGCKGRKPWACAGKNGKCADSARNCGAAKKCQAGAAVGHDSTKVHSAGITVVTSAGWAGAKHSEVRGYQGLSMQRFGSVCILGGTGGLPYNGITHAIQQLTAPFPLGKIPAELKACLPTCCITLFSGTALYEVCPSGDVTMASSYCVDMDPKDKRCKFSHQKKEPFLNVASGVFLPKPSKSRTALIGQGLFTKHQAGPFAGPSADPVEATTSSPSFCVLGGRLIAKTWSSSSLRHVVLTLPSKCRPMTQITLPAGVRADLKQRWNDKLIIKPNGQVQLVLKDKISTAPVELSLGGIVVPGAAKARAERMDDVGEEDGLPPDTLGGITETLGDTATSRKAARVTLKVTGPRDLVNGVKSAACRAWKRKGFCQTRPFVKVHCATTCSNKAKGRPNAVRQTRTQTKAAMRPAGLKVTLLEEPYQKRKKGLTAAVCFLNGMVTFSPPHYAMRGKLPLRCRPLATQRFGVAGGASVQVEPHGVLRMVSLLTKPTRGVKLSVDGINFAPGAEYEFPETCRVVCFPQTRKHDKVTNKSMKKQKGCVKECKFYTGTSDGRCQCALRKRLQCRGGICSQTKTTVPFRRVADEKACMAVCSDELIGF